MWNTAPIAAGSGVTATVRPPDQGNAPLVGDVTGLGIGGGAGIGANADSSFGNVRFNVGLAPSASGSLTLAWPVAPPPQAAGVAFAADWATVSQAALAGPSLDLNFMVPGTLPSTVTMTRGSTATFIDGNGIVQTVSGNTPRWDFDPIAHVLNGLLIEEARTNIAFPSGNLAAAPWTPVGIGGGTVPTVVANAAMAPDGTTTATQINYPATAAGVSSVNNNLTMTAAGYACSIYARGVVGGETIWLSITQNATLYYRVRMQLTTQWQRFSFPTGTLTAQAWALILGVDLRDGSGGQTPQPAQGVYVWGAQVELGGFATSYIPTTAAAVTRNGEFCDLTPLGAWFTSPSAFTQAIEYITNNPCTSGGGFWRFDDGGTANAIGFIGQSTPPLAIAPAQFSATVLNFSPAGTTFAPGAVHKAALTNVVTGDAWAVDGIVQDAAGTPPSPVPVGLNRLRIGNWGTGVARVFNGWFRRGRYWPRVLNSAELADATLAVPQALVLTVNWTATRPLIPGETVRLAYRWNISN